MSVCVCVCVFMTGALNWEAGALLMEELGEEQVFGAVKEAVELVVRIAESRRVHLRVPSKVRGPAERSGGDGTEEG